jgi:hypothetical protein
MVNGAVRALARFWGACVLAVLTIFFSEGSASAAPHGTLVLIVDGGAGEKLASAIGTQLPAPWSVADAKAFSAAAKNHKLPSGLGSLDDEKTEEKYLQTLGQVITEAGANAAVAVQVQKGRRRFARVILLSAAGASLVDRQVTLAGPEEDAMRITRAFQSELAALVPAEGAKPGPAPAPSPAGPTLQGEPAKPSGTEPAPAASASASASAGPSSPSTPLPAPWMVATVAFQLANRRVGYRDVITANIHHDNSGFVPTPAIGVDFFPFAIAKGSRGFLADFGLFGDFMLGLGAEKKLTDGTTVPVGWSRFDAGLKYRLWLKERNWGSPMLAFSLSFGQEAYLFHNKTPPEEPLDTPSAAYKIVRPRVDARVPIGPIALSAGLGYLGVLNTVSFVKKFRDPSVYAWEAEGAVSVPLGSIVEPRVGVSYRRFVHQFHPKEGDDYIANVATDQILRVELGVSAHF